MPNFKTFNFETSSSSKDRMLEKANAINQTEGNRKFDTPDQSKQNQVSDPPAMGKTMRMIKLGSVDAAYNPRAKMK